MGRGLLSLAGSRACNCPSRTPSLPLTYPVGVSFRFGLPLPPRPVPRQDRSESFPNLPGPTSPSPDPRHRREDLAALSSGQPWGRPPRAAPHPQGRLASPGDPLVCAFSPPRLGDAACPASPRGPRATAQCPLPHPEFSGPAPRTGGRGPRALEAVVAVWRCTLCHVILLVYLPSRPNLSGRRRTVPFGPC